ncbi:carboxypeptidase-like regulatory domain-containing protein [Mucilaginibacter sp.]|uniref:carboxypeptidase-like regulatory domain-containing protein n=1 Tax=Mucilaginibacter sp. TaxID=1882438 RepID=UPI00262269BE|nr:TonB-dependent receptor plug domain-containing protein [Mucilaginibacter sp.]MDB4922992.1 hypothetical protein [Mucilaginibacter sp.]
MGIYSFVCLTDDPFSKIRRQLEKWTLEQPVEKVYLHLDKPYYAAGDDIWFKAYVVSGGLHRLSTLSGILNVELIDEQDSIKQSVKLPLDSGVTNGDFALPDTLHQGNYRIRAYTNYMRNAGKEYFFDRQIAIINTINHNKNNIVKASSINNKGAGKIDVQFFPESGYLVNGITSKVAFKAVAPNGLGVAIKGILTDSKRQQVTEFASVHLGMGVFELTPKAGVTYQAKIIDGNGSAINIPLPIAVDKGEVLTIDDNDRRNLLVKIAISRPLLITDPGMQLTLIAESAGKIYFTAKTKAGTAVSSLVIPRNKFPSGIVRFTLFSGVGEPLNERLVFIQNTDRLNLKLTADRQVYAPRQKVKLMLTAQNSNNQPAAGSFSVSVTGETRMPADEDTQNNILASLLLTSDLRGYVEQAAWYFNHADEKSRAALDVLMLTQGYHRFEWKEILKDVYPAKQYRPENSLQVSGTVLTTGGKPVIDAKVKLFDLDSIQFTRDAVTDEHGRFIFKNLTFDDSVRFIVQARTSKNKKDVDIKMDKLMPASTSSNKISPDFQNDFSGRLAVYAQSSKQLYEEQRRYGLGNHVISLQEVVIREKRQAVRNSSNLNGPGNADQIIMGKDLQAIGCINISDCLQGRLVGVNFSNGVAYSTRDFRPMQLIVDGMYVEDKYLNTVNYNDVQAIEVLRNIGLTSIYGGRGGSGVLLVTTKRGDENDEPEPVYGRGITTYYPKGYYKARKFYSPLYDRSGTNKQLADLRTTIYWNPNLLTGKDGNTFFEYFNAGSKGTYRVVIEGIDNKGHLGRLVYHYHVQ